MPSLTSGEMRMGQGLERYPCHYWKMRNMRNMKVWYTHYNVPKQMGGREEGISFNACTIMTYLEDTIQGGSLQGEEGGGGEGRD